MHQYFTLGGLMFWLLGCRRRYRRLDRFDDPPKQPIHLRLG
jgi:hypothetical protein